MEPQQSALYEQYMKSLKWEVLHIGTTLLFTRNFLFIGGIIKIHRPVKLPDTEKLTEIIRKRNIRTLVIEPTATQNEKELYEWCNTMRTAVRISMTPYLPTKTIRINLRPTEDELFHSFSEAKRRAVRRAAKNNVTVIESTNITDLIKLKNQSGGFLGFIATSGIKELWPIFEPKNASILIARNIDGKHIGAVLLLHYYGVSYYWIAGAVPLGKKLFAPTLLVWEAMKLAKKMKSTEFDFVGVWDERIPKENTSWHGFTKFKEGFGGKELYYPLIPRS